MAFRKSWAAALVTVGVVAVGFWVSFVVTDRLLADPTPEEPTLTAAPPGPMLLGVLVTSSNCGASRYPGLLPALPVIREKLRGQAEVAGRRFSSVGVSLDDDPAGSIEFLKPFGPFDEVLAGGGWLSTGSVVFLVRDFPGRQALPQFIVIERDIVGGQTKKTLGEVRDRLVERKVGYGEIIKFAELLKAGS